MKVIVAGLSKTGTKSMQLALKTLGYNVYDFMENYTYLRKDWEKIFLTGGSTEDFYRMFKNVDAVTDNPAAYFWDEIYAAFPDSKIILMMRDSEDDWARSMKKQLADESDPFDLLRSSLSPSFRRFWKFNLMSLAAIYGTTGDYFWFSSAHYNMTLFRMAYRRHNSHVLQTAPKDKLLVFNIKEGWEPLCKFLGVEVPNKPFPHKNVRGQMLDEWWETYPFFIQCQREINLAFVLIGLLSGVGIYKFVKCSGFSFLRHMFANISSKIFSH